MMRSRIICILLVLAGALAAPVHGQTIDSPYRFLDYGQAVSLLGGFVSASDGRIGNGPESAPYFGAGYSIRVSGPFAFAADIGFIPTTRTVRDTAFIAADSMFEAVGESDMNILVALGSLRFNITGARTWNGLQPYALVGAGAALDLASPSEADEDLVANARFDFGTSFAGVLGAGVDWYPTSRVSLRVDVRDMFWKVPIPEAFRLSENGDGLPESEWEQNFLLAAGLSIHF